MPDPLENNAQEAKNQQNEEQEKRGVLEKFKKELWDLKSSQSRLEKGKLSLEKGESLFEGIKAKLHDAFPTIPEDLNNKCVTIGYEQDNWVNQNIFLYSDGLVVDKINGKKISINKIKGQRKGLAHSRTKKGLAVIEKFYPYEFAQWINKIIENADKCEIIVENLDWPRFPVDE